MSGAGTLLLLLQMIAQVDQVEQVIPGEPETEGGLTRLLFNYGRGLTSTLIMVARNELWKPMKTVTIGAG
jgi:hypothetical protein